MRGERLKLFQDSPNLKLLHNQHWNSVFFIWTRFLFLNKRKTDTRKAKNAHWFCRGSPLAAPRAIESLCLNSSFPSENWLGPAKKNIMTSVCMKVKLPKLIDFFFLNYTKRMKIKLPKLIAFFFFWIIQNTHTEWRTRHTPSQNHDNFVKACLSV